MGKKAGGCGCRVVWIFLILNGIQSEGFVGAADRGGASGGEGDAVAFEQGSEAVVGKESLLGLEEFGGGCGDPELAKHSFQ